MQTITLRKAQLVRQYILANVSKLFPQYTLVNIERRVSERYYADLHLKDKEGNDIFVEIKSTKINNKDLGKILDHYSSILNYPIQSKNGIPKLILIGEVLEDSLKRKLYQLDIKFISLNKLGFSYEKMLNIEKDRLRILTPTEAQIVLDYETKEQNYVTVDTLAKKLSNNKNYASKLMRRLERKGWFEKVSSGVYSFIPASHGYEERFPSMNPFLIGSLLIQPYYYGYSTANSYYGFSTQLPSTYYIVTKKKKSPYQWKNIRFQFITLSTQKFFGFKEVEILGIKVKISNPEKTIIDNVDKIQYCGGIEEVVNVIHRGLKQTNELILIDYLTRIDSYSLNQRFGFIIDFLYQHNLIKLPSLLYKYLLQNIGIAHVYLDFQRPKYGKFIKKWNIIQNMLDKDILTEIR